MPGVHNGKGISDIPKSVEPIPEGKYHLRIISADSGTIKTGSNYGCDKVTVSFSVIGGTYSGRTINYHNVSFLPAMRDGEYVPGSGMALNFLKCIGEPYSTEGEYTWDERRWIGKICSAYVVIEPDGQGRKWNRIRFINEPDKEYRELNLTKQSIENDPLKGIVESIPF